MSITVICDKCGKRCNFAESYAGRQVKCMYCLAPMTPTISTGGATHNNNNIIMSVGAADMSPIELEPPPERMTATQPSRREQPGAEVTKIKQRAAPHPPSVTEPARREQADRAASPLYSSFRNHKAAGFTIAMTATVIFLLGYLFAVAPSSQPPASKLAAWQASRKPVKLDFSDEAHLRSSMLKARQLMSMTQAFEFISDMNILKTWSFEQLDRTSPPNWRDGMTDDEIGKKLMKPFHGMTVAEFHAKAEDVRLEVLTR